MAHPRRNYATRAPPAGRPLTRQGHHRYTTGDTHNAQRAEATTRFLFSSGIHSVCLANLQHSAGDMQNARRTDDTSHFLCGTSIHSAKTTVGTPREKLKMRSAQLPHHSI